MHQAVKRSQGGSDFDFRSRWCCRRASAWRGSACRSNEEPGLASAKARRIGRVPRTVLEETVGKILALIDPEAR